MKTAAILSLMTVAIGTQAFAARDVHDRTTTALIPVSETTLVCTEAQSLLRPYGEPPDTPTTPRVTSQVQLKLDPPLQATFAYGSFSATIPGSICAKVKAILANTEEGKVAVEKNVHTEISTYPGYVDCRSNTRETVTLNFGDVKLSASQSKTEKLPMQACDQ